MTEGGRANKLSHERQASRLLDRFDLSLAMILLVSVVGAAQFKVLTSEPASIATVEHDADPVQAPDLSHLPAIPRPGVPIFDIEASWDRDATPSALDDLSREPVRVAPSARLGMPDRMPARSTARKAQ